MLLPIGTSAEANWFSSRIVGKKYNEKLKKRLEGTGVNPSYMAHYEDECNVTVRAGTHQPRLTWSVMQLFDVDVCKGEAKGYRWTREGKVFDNF